jgi:hypothetical protein
MPFLETNHERAALLVLLLGVALVIALFPFVTGLVGIPVMYVVFAPVHPRLRRHLGPHLAASLVVVLVIRDVVPGVAFAGFVNEAQQIAGGVLRAAARPPPRASGRWIRAQLPIWGQGRVGIGSSAFGLIGTATWRSATISLFGLFTCCCTAPQT